MPEEMPCEEIVLDGIIRTCDDIMRLAALPSRGTTHADVGYLHTHLSSLTSLLKTVPPLRSVTNLRGPIQDCSLAVASLKESLSQMPADSPKDKKQITTQIRSLIDVHNALSLRLRVEHIADESELTALKSGLDSLSREAMAAADGFFHRQPLRHQARGKFVIREQLILAPNQSKNTGSTNVTVCPSADFDAMPGHTPPSGERVKFICCCDNSRECHDSRLRYKQVINRAWPFELVRSGTKRTWQMILRKESTESIVLVSLAELVPTCILEFQEWVVNQACGWAVKHKLDGSPPYAIVTSNSLLLQTAECDQELFHNRLPRQIRIHTRNRIVKWDKKPIDMHIWHYSRALWDDTDDGRERDRQSSKLLLPQPWARLQFDTEQPTSPTQAQVDNSLSINIFANSTVTYGSRDPLWVRMLKVQMAQVSIECSLEFSRSTDAETFANQVDQMRRRLLQGFVQGAREDEAEVFVQDSSTLSTISDADELARTRVSVVSSKRDGHKPPNMRMIVTRDGFPGSLCLDFGFNTLEVSKIGLQNSHDLVGFYRHYYDDRGIPITEEINRRRLVSQGRDSAQAPEPQSLEGSQIVRDRERTAVRLWLNNIDQLRKIMRLNTEHGEYDRARVCVIDTGLRQDYKLKLGAFKDFVDPTNQSVRDESTRGHGTMCAHIIHSIYPQCEFYVARILADDYADNEIGSARMADAIEWALSEEVRADIISISAGFREESPRLAEAVRKAGGHGKLIFAAASNWGNIDGVAFPARDSNTICIYSTNTADQPSGFNPEPQQNTDKFALMGEGWPLPSVLKKDDILKKDDSEPMKGTSMATAASVGLAALILDFSRQSDNLNTFRGQGVHHKGGMVAIFESISKPAKKFRCIDPRYLLPDYGTSHTPVADVASPSDNEQRARVRWRIKDALTRKKAGIGSY